MPNSKVGLAAVPLWVRTLGAAAHKTWVWLGFLATTLIVLGSLTPAYLPQNTPLWRPMRAWGLDGPVGKIGGTLLVLIGLTLLVQCWLMVRHLTEEIASWAVLVIWSVPLIIGPPVFSHDAYSYAAQGWLVHNGLNPYEVGPGALPGAFADQSAWVWRFTPTPYGPLSLHIQHGLVMLCGKDPYFSAWSMRLPALVGVALITIFVPRIARFLRVDPKFASWFAVLNPLTVLDFVGGAHNDSLMTGLFVVAIWVAYRYRTWSGMLLGAVIVGVAASIKQPAFLAAYALAFIFKPLKQLTKPEILRAGLRVLASCGVAIGSFLLISFASGYGLGWIKAVNVPGSVITLAPFTMLGRLLEVLFGLVGLSGLNPVRICRILGMVFTIGLILILAVTKARRQPMSFLSWAFIAAALGAPALHGWYLLWGGVLLPHSKPSDRVVKISVWVSVLLLSYAAINFSQRNENLGFGLAALVLAIWQLFHHHRRQHPAVLDQGAEDESHTEPITLTRKPVERECTNSAAVEASPRD